MKIRRCRVGSYRRVGRRALVSRAGDERDSHRANPRRAAGRYVGRVLGSVEGIVKLRPTAVLDAQHGGFTAGWSPVSWGSIDELFVNLTIPRRGLAASRRPRVRRARPPRTESPGARQSPDPAAVDSTATPWSRPVPPAARWDVARRLSVSSVIHDRPSTPRSSSWTVRPGPNRHQPAPGRATHAAVCARAPAELGTPSSESPLENRGVKLVRLNGYPQREQS